MEHFFYEAQSREVPGEKGCFTTRAWNRGDLLERIVLDDVLHHIMHVDDFMDLSEHPTAKYCYRFSGDLLHYSQEKRLITDYINHSNTPNVVIYMGCTIALAEILPGDEILADYRFLMHERFEMDCGSYSVKGFSSKDADREFLRICADLRRHV